MKKRAFTLAEVLITLGIIGVVAALTIPVLVQKYKASVMLTTLKKDASIISQAYQMATIDYGDDRDILTTDDPESAYAAIQKYYAPYIQFIDVKKTDKAAIGYFKDGSAMYLRKIHPNACGEGWNGCNMFIWICINKKACDNIDETESYAQISNGKDVLGIHFNGAFPGGDPTKHDQNLSGCLNGSAHGCTKLIVEAGFKIPDDYPVKF